MSVVKANDFVPNWGWEKDKSKTQLAFEEDLRLHQLTLDLSHEQREKLRADLNRAMLSSAEYHFNVDPDNQSWLGFNNQRVLPIDKDIKPFFDNTMIKFGECLKSNWNRLMEERTIAIRVKANNALYAGYKTNFTPGSNYPPLTFKDQHISPTNPTGVNINRMIHHIDWVFKGLLDSDEDGRFI